MKTSRKKTIPFEAKTTEEAMKKAIEHFGVAGEEDLAIEKTDEVKGFWGDIPEKVIIHVRPRVPEPQPGELDTQWAKAIELTRRFLEDIFRAATLEVDVDVHP